MPTSDMSKEVKVVVKGELLADSTASRKLLPPKVEKTNTFSIKLQIHVNKSTGAMISPTS